MPIQRAAEHVGDSACVAGRVFRVSEGPSGTTFLNFCADYRTCPFTVVVFPRDLRHVGDVRQLAGKEIRIQGKIQAYDGRPEIVLRESRQLRGAVRKLPPLPREYDVERRNATGPESGSTLPLPARPQSGPKALVAGFQWRSQPTPVWCRNKQQVSSPVLPCHPTRSCIQGHRRRVLHPHEQHH
jgi:hypothetical protein